MLVCAVPEFERLDEDGGFGLAGSLVADESSVAAVAGNVVVRGRRNSGSFMTLDICRACALRRGAAL